MVPQPGLGQLMKQSAKKKLLIALVVTLTLLALPAGIFGWVAHTAHRSVPGRIVRWFSGEPTALQWTNDKRKIFGLNLSGQRFKVGPSKR
jgi:hypothetical protein